MFDTHGTRVVSINLDEPPRAPVIRQFSQQQGFTFPILMQKTADKVYDVDKDFLVVGTPTSYLIDGDGTVVDAHNGPVSPEELEVILKKLGAE